MKVLDVVEVAEALQIGDTREDLRIGTIHKRAKEIKTDLLLQVSSKWQFGWYFS